MVVAQKSLCHYCIYLHIHFLSIIAVEAPDEHKTILIYHTYVLGDPNKLNMFLTPYIYNSRKLVFWVMLRWLASTSKYLQVLLIELILSIRSGEQLP